MLEFTRVVKTLALLLLMAAITNNAAAIVAGPITDVDAQGPYTIDQGDDITLEGSVSISAMPEEWETIINANDPDAPLYYSMYFHWDLDSNPADYEAGYFFTGGYEAGTINSSPFEVYCDDMLTDYYANKSVGTYPATLYVDVEIYGGNESEGIWIEYYPQLLNDSTEVTVAAAVSPLVADAGGPYQGQTGEPITFDGSGSYDSRTLLVAAGPNSIQIPAQAPGIATYEWDFESDGVYDAVGETVNHTFGTAGMYQVTLKVTSNDGYNATDTTAVEILNNSQIPEFPSLAIPMVALIGLALFFRRREE